MPNKLISELPLVPAAGTSVAPVSDAAGTTTSKVTLASIAALGGGAPGDGTVTTAKLADAATTYAKIQNVAASDRVLGRATAGAGGIEEIPCTAFGRSVLAAADQAAGRTALGVAAAASPVFSGNVGIGTGTPSAALDVNGAAAVSTLLVRAALSGAVPLSLAEGRLTLNSNAPEPSGDLTAQPTLYYVPARGNKIMLYDTAAATWRLYTFANLAVSLSALPANTNHDVFVYDNSGTVALQLVAWTSDTARPVLNRLGGILTLGGAGNSGRRYVGTIRTTTAGAGADTETQRFVWNYDNQIMRRLFFSTNSSHTYAGNAWRPWANSTALGATRVAFVTGASGVGSAVLIPITATLTSGIVTIAVDSTAGSFPIWAAANTSPSSLQITATLTASIAAGYHYLQAVQTNYASLGVGSFGSIYSASALMG